MSKFEDIDKSGIDPEILKNPIFQRVAKDALEMQDRFAAEPVYARTGKGYLKSIGVEEMARVKEEAERQQKKNDLSPEEGDLSDAQ